MILQYQYTRGAVARLGMLCRHYSQTTPSLKRPKKFLLGASLDLGTVVSVDKDMISASSLEYNPIEFFGVKPRKFAENITTMQHVRRAIGKVEKEQHRQKMSLSQARHQAAREQILNGEKHITYREIQKLVRINRLGKATGKRELLEGRLFTYFRRMDPHHMEKMTRWELKCMKEDLNGDEEDNRAAQGAADDDIWVGRRFPPQPTEEDRKRVEQLALIELRDERKYLQGRAHDDFVADLEYYEACVNAETQKECDKEQHQEVMGAFFAAPATTGRSKCKICGKKIEKNTIRVTHNSLFKRSWKNSHPNSWTVLASHTHRHASCFIDFWGNSTTKREEDATEDDASDEFLLKLENSLVGINNKYEQDKDYQRMLFATPISFPANAMTFGREDPDIVATSHRETGVFMVTADENSIKK